MTLNIRTTKLREKLARYQKVVLYGAGQMAKELCKVLEDIGVVPAFCVVTSATNGQILVTDTDVYEIGKCEEILRDRNSITIIAVTEKYQHEIAGILKNKRINNWLLLSDYLWYPFCGQTYHEIYRNQSFEWYKDRIDEWEKNNLCGEDLNSFSEFDNCIVFILKNPAPRVCKILHALQKKGERIVVFVEVAVGQADVFKPFMNQIERSCNRYILFEYIEELLCYLRKLNSKIIHVFSNAWDPYLAFEIVRLKQYLGKVIFENYDIINGMITLFDEEHLYMEKYCLENADGVTCREFVTEYLINELHFSIKKVLVFFDYCTSDAGEKVKRSNCRELSLCYAGGIVTEKECPGVACACLLELGQKCEENKCHLHIYPSVWSEEKYKDYIEFESKSKYFHLHRPVSFEELNTVISQYDFGIHPVKSTVGMKDEGYTTRKKYLYGATNKFFDYLDAGLPIIACSPFKQADMFENEQVLIKWSIDEYDFDIMRKCKEEYKRNVKKANQKFSMDSKIGELIEFYNLL